MITQITTHQDDALLRLMEQFKCRENLIKILEIYLPLIQELEDVAFQLLEVLNIDLMEGQFLDYIGEIVGLERVPGQNDPRYRQLLKAKIGTNVSEGTPNQSITSVFKILTGSAWVYFQDHFNGNISLTGTASFTDIEEIQALHVDMDKVLAAGVRMVYFICADETEAFAFAGAGPAALGFDDESDTLGGMFAEEYIDYAEFAFAGSDEDGKGFGAGADDPFAGGVFLP